MPERSDFLEGDSPAAAKVETFLSQAFAATGSESPATAGALVPWVCDVLPSNHLVKAYPAETLQGIRDPALMSVFFITGCRVSAVTGACVGHLETDGVEH